jgi:hypothetical protein
MSVAISIPVSTLSEVPKHRIPPIRTPNLVTVHLSVPPRSTVRHDLNVPGAVGGV